MTAESITLDIEVPEAVVTSRTVEVACGDSFVTIRQVMGRTDADWTVYEGDAFDIGRNKGLVGKIDKAPTAANSEELVPWAADLVTRRERAKRATIALRRQADDQPHPVPTPDEQT